MKYPKLTLLFFTYLIAIVIFKERIYLDFLSGFGYLGTFISGIFYDYGLTSGIATALLMILAKSQNLIIAGFIGGLGALIGDLIIFKVLRYSFKDELLKLGKEKIFRKLGKILPKFSIPALSCIIIASPLPDEIGIFLLAFSFKIRYGFVILASFILNTLGIFAILLIGNSL